MISPSRALLASMLALLLLASCRQGVISEPDAPFLPSDWRLEVRTDSSHLSATQLSTLSLHYDDTTFVLSHTWYQTVIRSKLYNRGSRTVYVERYCEFEGPAMPAFRRPPGITATHDYRIGPPAYFLACSAVGFFGVPERLALLPGDSLAIPISVTASHSMVNVDTTKLGGQYVMEYRVHSGKKGFNNDTTDIAPASQRMSAPFTIVVR